MTYPLPDGMQIILASGAILLAAFVYDLWRQPWP